VLSRLIEVFAGVESEMLFLERNTLHVAELKHVTEREGHSTINHQALPDTSTKAMRMGLAEAPIENNPFLQLRC
jgi:hypothetical protein